MDNHSSHGHHSNAPVLALNSAIPLESCLIADVAEGIEESKRLSDTDTLALLEGTGGGRGGRDLKGRSAGSDGGKENKLHRKTAIESGNTRGGSVRTKRGEKHSLAHTFTRVDCVLCGQK